MSWLRPTLVLLLVAALLAPLGPAQAQDPPPAVTDIVFSLDGSGSISSADWQLQKDGYSAAMADQNALPRDGSVAVGVVQWSGSQRTEIPLTVIDEQSDVDTLVNQIQAISQIGGSTGAGNGLAYSADVLMAAARDGTQRNICMSTDGTNNTGQSVADGAAHAQNVGVDKFAVVGIEDGGNGDALRAEYGPHVFGGGTFSLARNTAEFASLITGGCFNDPVQLVALEVNQAIQSWNNHVTLVEGKPTTVRAFLEVLPGDDPQRVNGRLIGRRNGSELVGSPLAASNPGGGVIADDDIVSERGDLTKSLNFVLPASWRSGDVELEFDGGGTAIDCSNAIGSVTDACIQSASFADGADTTLKVIGVPFTQGGSTVVPSPAALLETGLRTRTTLPVSSMSIDVQNTLFTTFAGPPSLDDVNNQLAVQRMLDLCFALLGCDTLYYGQLSGNDGGGKARGIPSDVSSGWDYDLDGRNDAGFFRNVAPHEVGHSLGLHHSVKANKQGPCGSRAGAAAPVYPYFADVGGRDRSLLGNLGDDATENWGVDNRFVRNDANNLAIVHPKGARATFDLMGYCWIASPQDLWPSDYTWDLLRTSLNSRFGVNAADSHTTTGDHVIVSGRVDLQADTATATAAAVLNGEVPIPPTGDYTVQLLDDVGGVLSEVDFEIEVDAGRPGIPNEEDPPPDGSFTVPVPHSGPFASIVILHNAAEIGRTEASENAPTLTLDAPANGSVNDGPTVTFAWTGNDADPNTTLTYNVRYSADSGTTWTTLAVGTEDSSIEVPRDQLTGSTTAKFQVQASDGVNITSETSGEFTVAGNDPAVVLTSPTDGESFYSGVQQVVLEASASDPENGDVSDSIVWTSSENGQIATGPDGSVGADELDEGDHTITATATDSDGNDSSSSVDITVLRIAPAPPTATLSVDPTSGAAPLDVTATVGGSSDTQGASLTYTLDWGDGTQPDTGALPASPVDHTYTAAGTYTVTLQVDDGFLTTQATRTVTVEEPPPPPPGGGPVVAPTPTPSPTTETTDTEDDGATPDKPLEVTVTAPGGGDITINVVDTDDDGPAGWSLLGMTADITAPDATAQNPLQLVFLIDPSLVPPGHDADSLAVFRNGQLVPGCTDGSTATPDPCVAERTTTDDGDVRLVVRTSQASVWSFATAAVACPAQLAPPAPFTDVSGTNVHSDTIACLAWWEIVLGTSDTTYDPSTRVTRAQMASFLARLLADAGVALPAAPADAFTDDGGSVHERAINQLAALGLVRGLSGSSYGPGATVTRAQMATMMVNAYEQALGETLPDAGEDRFTDDTASVHHDNINKAAAAGVTSGLSAGTYGPQLPVRRDQMASFLSNVLDGLVTNGITSPQLP